MGETQLQLTVKKILFLLGDCIILNAGIYAALLLRFDTEIPKCYIDILPRIFFMITLVNISTFSLFGLYSKLWNYASIEELIQILLATITGALLTFIVELIIPLYLPISANLIFFMITFVFIGGFRLSSRFYFNIRKQLTSDQHTKKIMIVGAGVAGSLIIKEMKNNTNSKYTPVVAIDDDNSKHKTKINGIKVIGGRDKIHWAVKRFKIDEIIITMPSVQKKDIEIIFNICKKTKCKLKILPQVFDLLKDDFDIKELKDFNIEDLLRRDKIDLNLDEIAIYLKDEVILVTGGGGSIGSELCRQIARFRPKRLLIFDIYENGVYDLQNELLKKYNLQLNMDIIIGSIRDRGRLDSVFSRYKPSVIFHTAAHKHVPLMEDNPGEAIKNNVIGTLNLAECADKFNCKKFVLISTDKAVNPLNIMGATKRISEILIKYMDKKSKTIFTAVRFGNVLGSNGSVIPLFKKQIEEGGPVTVTHPEVTRYFMTIPEAASLVIQAGTMAKGGEIFILDMGEPVRILDLAKIMITQSGLTPDVDINIMFTGLRPGEKLHEELLINNDSVNITKNNNIFIEKSVELDYEKIISEINRIRYKQLNDPKDITDFIKRIIPEYKKSDQ
ncbi:MAG TPA: nucleoside-diphosphate sugar epimerase/dehydratase [Pseudobacteroides sp.]|uniref:nucleoside-diphosphate sugar epimerase/dehydratase n=1 Tax=Pseudobacteroides sp. TaxID=1968840 RepID=UPI002F91CE34